MEASVERHDPVYTLTMTKAEAEELMLASISLVAWSSHEHGDLLHSIYTSLASAGVRT